MGKAKKEEPAEPEAQPVLRTYLVRIVGFDVRPGYTRAGISLKRTWQSFALSPEQLALLQSDKRVRVKNPEE